MTEAYRGALGAFPYAVRASDSWFFRVYWLVGSLAALFIALVVGMGLIVELARTADLVRGGLVSFSRSLFVLVGFLAVGPLVAPVLLVARRHRLGTAVHRQYDQALAACGYAFLASLYLALVISAPPDFQTSTDSAVLALLYAAHPLFGLLPPFVAAAVMILAHRRLRG
ncbi:hypothetical protein SAMN05192561_104128 [Halopenitus malekzadehii]|uniref:DUF8056 domain-containing protein n=1 Tax=Halopenitus malekzadehii TaxID=1267564 RepID=A0A1H6IW32_9EURY|nr:hypothetical protein [Halopenitus malekzadehii]SEH52370.1 hypothetical protein SAMN05192561_104128 [Halopenitus malekzadehii]